MMVNGNDYDHDGDLKDGHAMMIQRASLPDYDHDYDYDYHNYDYDHDHDGDF